jgi:hypothetical protein
MAEIKGDLFMKKKIRFLFIIAIVAIIGFSMACGGGSTSSSYFTFDSTKGIITGYSGAGPKDVKIPKEIKGTPVMGIDFERNWDRQLTSITIPDSISEVQLDYLIEINEQTLNRITIGPNTKISQYMIAH